MIEKVWSLKEKVATMMKKTLKIKYFSSKLNKQHMTVEEKNINNLKKYMASLTFFIEHEQKSTELVSFSDKLEYKIGKS